MSNTVTGKRNLPSSAQKIVRIRAVYKRDSDRLMIFLHLMVLFFVAAVLSWMLSHWWFGVAFSGHDYPPGSREIQMMNMWNVLMYFVPGTFAVLSAGCLAVGVVFESLGLFGLYTTVLWQKYRVYRQGHLNREAE